MKGRLQELHDRMTPHIRTPRQLREWPEHLQDAPERYAKKVRTRLELELVTILSMATVPLLLDELGVHDGTALGVVALHAVALGVLTWTLLRAGDAGVLRVALKAARAEPGRVPGRYVHHDTLGAVVRQELDRLTPAEREVAETLLSDGYEGTVAELVELSQRTLAPARA